MQDFASAQTGKSKKKGRRERTVFTKSQIKVLEGYFQKTQYPDSFVREDLSKQVGITETRIQIWFKNRRAKQRQIQRGDASKFDKDRAPVTNELQLQPYLSHMNFYSGAGHDQQTDPTFRLPVNDPSSLIPRMDSRNSYPCYQQPMLRWTNWNYSSSPYRPPVQQQQQAYNMVGGVTDYYVHDGTEPMQSAVCKSYWQM